MTIAKRIVCLANSRKIAGRCIAGREFRDAKAGDWVRPVSARPHEEVSEEERQYEDGSDPKVLDILDVPVVEHRAKSYQRENWLLDDKLYWNRVGKVEWKELALLEDKPESLWINGHSTYHGLNDRILLADAAKLGNSLYLLRAPHIELSVFAPGEAFGNSRKRVQARFEYRGVSYRSWVTDPAVERLYGAKAESDYKLGECYLTVSLGEPADDGYCYKLVAAIIQK
jgi:hypothetical protein